MSRTIIGIRTLEFEYLRLEQRSEGIYLRRAPEGAVPGTDFKLTSVTTSEAVFENPSHDFPKRIIYRKTAVGVSLPTSTAVKEQNRNRLTTSR